MEKIQIEAGDARDAGESVERLFREHSGRMVATLTRVLGVAHLDLIEDVVQDALVTALGQWSFHGVPKNPSAWIIQVAKRRAIDILRRRTRWVEKESEVVRSLEAIPEDTDGSSGFAREVLDDQLQMILVCCHPSLKRDAQVALTLQLVGGFSAAEVASAFLTRKETMAQRLVRAKRTLRRERVDFELPSPDVLAQRLGPVLEVAYLMFNEGFGAHEGEDLVREDLCREAVRLITLVADHPAVDSPEAEALAALCLFQAGRLPARVDEGGELVLLEDQDRALWDRRLLSQGARFLARSARGSRVSAFHLEAEIASYHALAADFDSTDWPRILEGYDALWRRNPSPVVATNRLVAVEKVHGPRAALDQSRELLSEPALEGYVPARVLYAELLARNGRTSAARRAFEAALSLAANRRIRRHLERRLAELEAAEPADA